MMALSLALSPGARWLARGKRGIIIASLGRQMPEASGRVQAAATLLFAICIRLLSGFPGTIRASRLVLTLATLPVVNPGRLRFPRRLLDVLASNHCTKRHCM